MNENQNAPKKMPPLEKAILFCGGQGVLARHLGVSGSTISYWRMHCNGRPTTIQACEKIEKVTKGRVKASDFYPEFYA